MVSVVPTYSPEWHELRATHVGASEVGALLGVCPFSDAHTVWRRKNDPAYLHPESGVNTPMWWGHQDEPAIIEAAIHERWTGTNPWQRLGYAWYYDGFMVSPDAVITDELIKPKDVPYSQSWLIEAKSVGVSSAPQWRQGVPKHVLAQVHGQMALTGALSTVVAARICGAPVRTWVVERDEVIQSQILDLVRAFWRHTSKPDSWDTYTSELLERFGWRKRHTAASSREAEPEQIALLLDWEDAKRRERAAKILREELDVQVRELFGDDDALTLMGNTIAEVNTVRRESVDTTALGLDHPELYNRYKKTTEYKVYRKTPNLEGMR